MGQPNIETFYLLQWCTTQLRELLNVCKPSCDLHYFTTALEVEFENTPDIFVALIGLAWGTLCIHKYAPILTNV